VERAVLKAAEARGDLTINQRVEITIADLQKAFTPVTNSRKLANGRAPFDTLHRAISFASMRFRRFHLILNFSSGELSSVTYDLYGAILSALCDYNEDKFEERLRARYIYTFVREDIPSEQLLVQTAHAVYEMGHELSLKNGSCKPWQKGAEDTHLVCVGVRDGEALIAARDRLESKAEIVPFYESDMGGELTAFAAMPVRLSGRVLFRDYQKLKLPQAFDVRGDNDARIYS
jgi:hypothetical protein